MVTTKQVNAALQARYGEGIEIVKAYGYVYFAGTLVENCRYTSVSVPRLNIYTVEQWVEEADAFVRENAIRTEELKLVPDLIVINRI